MSSRKIKGTISQSEISSTPNDVCCEEPKFGRKSKGKKNSQSFFMRWLHLDKYKPAGASRHAHRQTGPRSRARARATCDSAVHKKRIVRRDASTPLEFETIANSGRSRWRGYEREIPCSWGDCSRGNLRRQQLNAALGLLH